MAEEKYLIDHLHGNVKTAKKLIDDVNRKGWDVCYWCNKCLRTHYHGSLWRTHSMYADTD